jgi:hypothetical protein
VSDATIQLLTSSEFFTSIAIGSVGVIAVMIWAAITRKPASFGGLVLTAAMVIAVGLEGEVTRRLAVALVLLVVAGFIPVRSPFLSMLVLVPGALAVASTQPSFSQTAVGALIMLSIIPLAPLVASFDERHASSTVATPLLAISIATVFWTVPDTEIALLAAGAAVPWLVAGPPGRFASLGRPGAFAAVGMLVWVVAVGGFSRTLALVAGIATLGVLVIEPVVYAVRTRSRPGDGGETTLSQADTTVLIAAHVAIMALISIVIRV